MEKFEQIQQWADGRESLPDDDCYCVSRDIFQARLDSFLMQLQKELKNDDLAFLLTAVVGEIGNNAFDHNLGSWPDAPGLCFNCDTDKRLIILADRGQGVLVTIKKAKPETATDEQALRIAFTEVVSGRSPERRGNGLKFVRQVAQTSNMELKFYSGGAWCLVNKDIFEIKPTEKAIPGVLAIIKF